MLGHGAVTGAASENDLSVAILVRFGAFEYITAGDLGGGDNDRSCTGRSTGQANVESSLAISLTSAGGANLLTDDGVEVMDVNHHGSESSTNRDYMNLLTPTVAASVQLHLGCEWDGALRLEHLVSAGEHHAADKREAHR